MATDYPITKTQYARLREKQQLVELYHAQYVQECAAVLASHDITAGFVSKFTETTITVEPPQEAV